jgi:hypothetical protein
MPTTNNANNENKGSSGLAYWLEHGADEWFDKHPLIGGINRSCAKHKVGLVITLCILLVMAYFLGGVS